MASVFFSYSHKDEALRDQLESHLALLKNQGKIDAWYDRRIVAGDEIDGAISTKLETADIILLLVSSDFISSPYCYSREMTQAMDRQRTGQAQVIPVILRHCDWHGAPFGKLMAAPRDGKPITSWPDRDEAFADVAKQVRIAVETIAKQHPPTKPPQAIPTSATQASIGAAPTPLKPRSSNLRLKKEFSERDRDEFLHGSFDFICKFFEGSLEAVGERNPDVTGKFDRIDSRRMAAILYRGGKKITECSIRLGGLGSRDNGIAFSYDASSSQSSFNEMLSVEANDQTMYLKSMGMSWGVSDRYKPLSQEGAAEFLWELFMKNAQ
jgi:hypothetical protein